MTSSFQEPICWRAASPCPLPQTASAHQFACQAWFRCERAGDYVIRWRCETLEDEALNFTGTALLLCRNQSESWQVTQCPPPVVCSDGNYKLNTPMTSSPTSTEITIIVALAAFAVFALVLIVVSSYKYWAMRKRYRTQKRHPAHHHPRHFLFRDYRFPMSYHNFWGPGLRQNQHKGPKTSHTSKAQGSSQPDVYFSRPQESWRYFEHLLTSSDDSIGNNNYISRQGRHGHVSSNGERLKVDPSVATESFVYHNPMRSGNGRDDNRGTLDWFYQNKLVNNESEDRENSVECYHIYKGNFGSFRAHKQNHDNRNCTNSRNEYHHIAKSNTEFVRGDLVSSIPIPGFSVNDLHETTTLRECMDFDLQLVDDNRGRHFQGRQVDSDSSYEGRSHHAHGVVSKSRNSQFSNLISGEMQQHNNRHRQNIYPSSSKAQRTITTTTPRTSPDVINSHNFTNRFVRIGKNIYRPVLTKSPSGSSLTLSSAKNNYLDVSYDSFLNEHIQELAHRGGASSSTFEAGHNQTESTNHRAANNRY